MANGARLDKNKKRALETASLSQKETDQPTVIPSAYGAKVLNNLDTLVKEYEYSVYTKEKTFIAEVADALGIPREKFNDTTSQYATFETKNGNIITIRLSNHNATPEKLAHNGQYDAISIVVTNKPNKGTVMPGLNSAEVAVVEVPRHHYTGNIAEATRQAIEEAKAKFAPNGKPTVQRYDNFGQKFDYAISGSTIDESLNPNQHAKIENKGVHLAVVEHLGQVINNSIEAEEHPDYKKVGGERRAENGVGEGDLLVHRMYGAVRIDGKLFRVKTTMHEYLSKGNAPHDYRVTKIELIISGSSTSNALNSSINGKGLKTYPLAKLLEGVEKFYDMGKKKLAESAKADAAGDGDTRGYTTTGGDGAGGRAGRASVEQAVADVDKRTGGDTAVIDSSEVPADVVKKLGEGVKGYVKGGKAYVVADNCDSAAEAATVAVHESAGREIFPNIRPSINSCWRSSGFSSAFCCM